MNAESAKNVVVWSSLVGSLVFWTVFLVFIAKELFEGARWINSVLESHPAVPLFLPLAALASFCNVLILKITDGPMELTFFDKFVFKGAAGPIIMWVLSFLAMCLGITMLWNLS